MMNNILISWNAFLDIEVICKLCLLIDSKLYSFFANLYGFYIDLAGRRIFNSTAIESLGNRIYIFVGVIALFILAYTLLKTLVSPDKGLKEGGGKLVFNIVSSLIMLVLIPVIFDFGYKIQEIIIDENILGKVFLGSDNQTSDFNKIEVNYEDMTLEDGTTIKGETLKQEYQVDMSKEIMKMYGNQTAFLVLNAFLYPNPNNTKEIEFDASEHFNTDTGIKWSAGLATTGVVVAGVLVLTMTAAFSGGVTLAAIPGILAGGAKYLAIGAAIGAASGLAINTAGFVIDSEHYTWDMAQMEIVYGGEFDRITAFSGPIDEGLMIYTPIISTVCGAILVYMMISFCLDLGIRAAKLAMYQVLAPVPILLRIIPGQEKSFNGWIKEVLTTFTEIFIRIGFLFGASYLISLIPSMELFSDNGAGKLAKCFIVLGIIAFVKEAPKLLGEAIGLKSAKGIKFGIKDKLAAGGALTVAAAAGAGATTFLRNGATGVKNAWAKRKEGDKKGSWKAAGVGALSALAGGVSGAVRGGKAGFGAKSYSDVSKAAEQGAKTAGKKAINRATYKAEHGGTMAGAFFGHLSDAGSKGMEWLNYSEYDAYEAEMKYYDYLTKRESQVKSETEKIRKKYANNSKIVARKVKYKGYDNGELDNLHQDFILTQNSSLDVLERELSTLSSRTSFQLGETVKYYNQELREWVDGYIDETGRVFERMFVHPETGQYYFDGLKGESASLLHNNYVSAFGSFVAQLTKETDLGLQDVAAAKTGAIYDLIKSDAVTLASNLSQIEEIYSEGLNKKAVQEAQSKIALDAISGAGHVYKAYIDAITERTADINAEKAKADRLREARKKDK